jgi:hypothetical protein
MTTITEKRTTAFLLLDGVLELARSIKSPELVREVMAEGGMRVDSKSLIARAIEAELAEAIKPLVSRSPHPKVHMVAGRWDHRRALYHSRERQAERATEADALRELLVFVQNNFGGALPYSYTEVMRMLYETGYTIPGLADE